MLLEDVGDGVHADRMGHVLDVDVENIATGQTVIHELDQVPRVRLRLGFQLLEREKIYRERWQREMAKGRGWMGRMTVKGE